MSTGTYTYDNSTMAGTLNFQLPTTNIEMAISSQQLDFSHNLSYSLTFNLNGQSIQGLIIDNMQNNFELYLTVLTSNTISRSYSIPANSTLTVSDFASSENMQFTFTNGGSSGIVNALFANFPLIPYEHYGTSSNTYLNQISTAIQSLLTNSNLTTDVTNTAVQVKFKTAQNVVVTSLPAININANSFVNINSVTAGQSIKSSSGIIKNIIVNTAGVASNLTLYNGTSTAGTVIGTFDTTSLRAIQTNINCNTGIYVVTTGTTAANITIEYQ